MTKLHCLSWSAFVHKLKTHSFTRDLIFTEYIVLLTSLISADAELLSECSIEGLEWEYQKYNVLSTESSKSKYFQLIKHCASGMIKMIKLKNKITSIFDLNFVLRYSI